MTAEEIFAANMRTYRIHAGLTQEELAEKSDLHRTYIGRIEQRNANITLKNAGKIAEALGMDLALFFMDASEVEALDSQRRQLSDYSAGDCALCTWDEDGIHLEPIDTDDPDQTLRILSILAEDNDENLVEGYMEVKKRMIVKKSKVKAY